MGSYILRKEEIIVELLYYFCIELENVTTKRFKTFIKSAKTLESWDHIFPDYGRGVANWDLHRGNLDYSWDYFRSL
jgi:hypothetical protein